MLLKYILFTFFLWTLNSSAQSYLIKNVKGDAIHLEFNKWDTKAFADISFVKTYKNHFVLTTGIGVGQFGNYVADRKTKNWYGNIQIPLDGDAYKSSDIGMQIHLRAGYFFYLNKIFNFELNFGVLLGGYNHKHEIKLKYIDEMDLGYPTLKFKSFQVNFGFGFDIKLLIRLTKKIYATIGVAMPYYVINQNELDVYKHFNPPLLGLSPSATIGLRYKFK